MGDFGYNLRKIREMRGLSPQQMAERIGKSDRTYLKTESGEREPTRTEMKEIAKALEIPEEMMMSLDKRTIFNSFNNNQEGDNNHYSSAGGLDILLSKMESRIEALEKLIVNLTGAKP
jgi:transcriptional regulator with XRE-family HTH domain